MVLHWRRCGRVGGRQIKKRKNASKKIPVQRKIWCRSAGEMPVVFCIKAVKTWRAFEKKAGMLSTKPSRVVIRVIGESFLISLGGERRLRVSSRTRQCLQQRLKVNGFRNLTAWTRVATRNSLAFGGEKSKVENVLCFKIQNYFATT